MPINRRKFVESTLATFASVFVIGKLNVAKSACLADEELNIVAAATYEYVLQTFVLDNEFGDELPEVTVDTLRAAKEISVGLEPDNAPEIFIRAKVQRAGSAFDVIFSDTVKVTINEKQVEKIKNFLHCCWDLDSPTDSDVRQSLKTVLRLLKDSKIYVAD